MDNVTLKIISMEEIIDSECKELYKAHHFKRRKMNTAYLTAEKTAPVIFLERLVAVLRKTCSEISKKETRVIFLDNKYSVEVDLACIS